MDFFGLKKRHPYPWYQSSFGAKAIIKSAFPMLRRVTKKPRKAKRKSAHPNSRIETPDTTLFYGTSSSLFEDIPELSVR